MNDIVKELMEKADPKYKDFHKRLIPTVDENTVLGVRSPCAQAIAKKYVSTKQGTDFLNSLPHRYYDENIVHAFMLGALNCPQEELKCRLVEFLPYVDNWAVCDGLCAHLKRFFKNPENVYDFVLSCIDLSVYKGASKAFSQSKEIYTLRFGLVCLLNYYISPRYINDILRICQEVKSQEYYVNMALAWLLSFCLIKEYESTLPLIQSQCLPKWVHNKAIQKSVESYRIEEDKKAYLRSLRIK